VPVLITDTAFTGPADPGSARDIAVKAFMAEFSFVADRLGFLGLTPRLPSPHGCVSDVSRAPGN
jgi:hypothetical protein